MYFIQYEPFRQQTGLTSLLYRSVDAAERPAPYQGRQTVRVPQSPEKKDKSGVFSGILAEEEALLVIR